MMAKKDLLPCRTKEEAKSRGRNGGINSGIARRKKKELRELLQALLETKRDDKTTAEALVLALVEKGLSGDVKAFETIRDTIGEKPVEKIDGRFDGGFVLSWGE